MRVAAALVIFAALVLGSDAGACGATPHSDACLEELWLQAGCTVNGLHAPPNGRSDTWRNKPLTKIQRLMAAYKRKAMKGMRDENGTQYVTLCTGKQGANCGPDSSPGPHTQECLDQMWRDVGCFDTGTHRPANASVQMIKKWNKGTVKDLREDMATYKTKALNWEVHKQHGPFVVLCFGSGMSNNQDDYIFGGVNVYNTGRWPWVALLYSGGYCTAAIIHPRWVLTSASCVENERASETYVKLGMVNLSSNNPPPVRVYAKQLIPHEDYVNTRNPTKIIHDIALIELKENVTFGPTIKPIGLPQPGGAPYKDCYMTGWGRTVPNGPVSSILQELKVQLVSDSYCRSIYGFDWLSTGGVQCVQGHGHGDSCPGDSGGPLNCKQGHDHYVTVGVVSFRKMGCDFKNGAPTGYGQVDEKVAWIREKCNNCI